ncbi:GapR family DNA-binding domain-containing protein [Methylobacterium sp. 1973]|uniref:DUF2312 domain-containing protein n=1 Tax=Methylobacterium sp. 1973 TaxID=3156421 RepID=UPI00339497EE
MSDAIRDGSADQQLASFIDRILRLREEIDGLQQDVKEIYAEARSMGFDKTAMGALVSELRKASKDASKAQEAAAILDLYREAYHRAASHTHAREAA